VKLKELHGNMGEKFLLMADINIHPAITVYMVIESRHAFMTIVALNDGYVIEIGDSDGLLNSDILRVTA